MKRIFKLHILYCFKNKAKFLFLIFFIFYFFIIQAGFSIAEKKDINYLIKETSRKSTQYNLEAKNISSALEIESNEKLLADLSLYKKASLEAGRLSDIYKYKDVASHAQGKKNLLEAEKELYDYGLIQELDVEYLNQEILLVQNRIENKQLLELSEYSLTSANFLNKVLSGYSLIGLLFLLLIWNFDIFGSDFESGVFKQLYSTEISRAHVFAGKLFFSIISSLAIVLIGMILGILFKIVIGQTASINELILVGENFDKFNNYPGKFELVSSIKVSSYILLNTVALITMFVSLIHFIAIFSKSRILTLSTVVVIVLFSILINGLHVYESLCYLFSIFNYQLDLLILNKAPINLMYNIGNSILFGAIFMLSSYYILLKSDMLGD